MRNNGSGIDVRARLNRVLLVSKMAQFGESPASLAAKLGIAKETVNRWLKDGTDTLPRVEHLCAMAAYFSTQSPAVHVARPGDGKHSLVVYAVPDKLPEAPQTKKFVLTGDSM